MDFNALKTVSIHFCIAGTDKRGSEEADQAQTRLSPDVADETTYNGKRETEKRKSRMEEPKTKQRSTQTSDSESNILPPRQGQNEKKSVAKLGRKESMDTMIGFKRSPSSARGVNCR